MTAPRVERLKDIGFEFAGKRKKHDAAKKSLSEKNAARQQEKMEKKLEKWDAMCGKVEAHLQKHGDLKFQKGKKLDKDEASVRSWLISQRKEFKKLRENSDSILTASRIMRLNDMGIIFKDYKTTTFDEWYEQLTAFKEVHGHCKVPRSRRVNDGLPKWVARMRHEYKQIQLGKVSSTLSQEQIQRLNDLGMIWEIIKQPPASERAARLPWLERFKQLLEFKEQNNHMNVPQHYPELGSWVHQQRNDYKLLQRGAKSGLTHEKALKLANSGFIFEVMPRRKVQPEILYEQLHEATDLSQLPFQPTLHVATKYNSFFWDVSQVLLRFLIFFTSIPIIYRGTGYSLLFFKNANDCP
uniref:Helicase-associated domain-containing protein n=3 Tax=Corethron hystrix TaxID=216773 RepID=A0A7S1BTI7_9STRA|mmetsp:Transcript_38649/g.89794  ORF Transcript_38649/g.89794 Transcript_38649/m.89794 type:complete len:354 (+) Transcript_38649:752-1813(+)